MPDMRLKQISAGNSMVKAFGGLSIAILAAAGCVKKTSDVPKPDFNNTMVKMETDPDLRLRELQRQSADFAELVHTLPDRSPQIERDKTRQAFGALTQLLPLVQVGPKGGVFSHQVSVVADTQTLLSGSSSDLSAVPIIDRGLRAVYNALDDAQHGGSMYYEDAALRSTLDQLSAKINEFDTARGALHDMAWADAFNLTSEAISKMTAILADRLGEGATTVPTTTPTEPGTAPSTSPTETGTAPPASPTTSPTTPSTEPATSPSTGPAADPAKLADQLREDLGKIGEALGGLSKDEQDKVTAFETALVDKLKADPAYANGPSFEGDTMKQFRDALTPEHQAKFDALIAGMNAERNSMLTGDRLKNIGIVALTYANGHGDQLPPDLGTLVSSTVSPQFFLAGDSKTQVPPDLTAQDLAKQAAWVNANTDFVYLGAGKQSSKLTGSYVVAYAKTGGDKQSFLMGDGSVQTFNADQSAKIIAELQAGTNPPTSLPK